MAGFTDRIVRDEVEDQVVGTIVDNFVRLVRLEEKCVARLNLDLAALVADDDDIFAWDYPVPKQVSSLTAGPYTTGWDSTS